MAISQHAVKQAYHEWSLLRPASAARRTISYSRSSSFRNFAFSGESGNKNIVAIARATVGKPSITEARIFHWNIIRLGIGHGIRCWKRKPKRYQRKSHCQLASLSAGICWIPKANIPPKAPASELNDQKNPNLLACSSEWYQWQYASAW